MFNPMNFAMNMIAQNPQFKNNPMTQNMIQIIQNGDNQKGQQFAENLCKSYGVSKEEAMNMATSFFKKNFNLPI